MSFKSLILLTVHLAPIIMAIITFIAAMGLISPYAPETQGIYAPLMALSAALMLLVNSLYSSTAKMLSVTPKMLNVIRGSLAAIFGGVSAYFWVADSMGQPPTDKDVWLGFGLVWYLVFAYAFFAALMIGLTLTNKDD